MSGRRLITVIVAGACLAGVGGVAHAWDCPPQVCSGGETIRETLGGVDWVPGSYLVARTTYGLDATTTGAWDATVGAATGPVEGPPSHRELVADVLDPVAGAEVGVPKVAVTGTP